MKDTKPFNLEHAKAGAPIATAAGQAVQILIWDRKANLPIIGIINNSAQDVMGWRLDGENANGRHTHLVMLPLGEIDGKPVFTGDHVISRNGEPCEVEPRNRNFDGCRWPAPAKVYPATLMRGSDLHKVYMDSIGGTAEGHQAVANAALRHAIDNGQVIPLDQHVREIGEAIAEQGRADRAARDMAVAKEVVKSLCWVLEPVAPDRFNEEYLLAVIARVQP